MRGSPLCSPRVSSPLPAHVWGWGSASSHTGTPFPVPLWGCLHLDGVNPPTGAPFVPPRGIHPCVGVGQKAPSIPTEGPQFPHGHQRGDGAQPPHRSPMQRPHFPPDGVRTPSPRTPSITHVERVPPPPTHCAASERGEVTPTGNSGRGGGGGREGRVNPLPSPHTVTSAGDRD